MDYIKKAFINYANFKGRASRKEFWYFALFNLLVATFFILLNLPILVFIYALITLVPSVSLAVRRLHDVNMSGWWFLPTFIISVIPKDMILKFFENTAWILVLPFLAYSLFMLYLFLKKGDLLPNKYGI